MEVIPQHGGDGIGRPEPFLLHPEPGQGRQREDQEVAAAHAGVEEADLGGTPGPAVEGAGGGAPGTVFVLDEAQVYRL